MNKKQFFLSMSKKQLISSLAVTSMIMNSMAGSIFANSNDSSSVLNEETELNTTNDCTELTKASSLGRCASGNFDEGVIGNDELKIPDIKDSKVEKSENENYTVKEQKGKKVLAQDGTIAYQCKTTKDKFTVYVRKIGYENVEGLTYAPNENFKINSKNIKVTYRLTDKQEDGKCHNIKGQTQIYFTVTTKNGITLGQNMKLDERTVYNDSEQTVQYKFHYTLDGSGEHFIDLDINPINKPITTPQEKPITTPKELVDALKTGKVKLTQDITFTENDIKELKKEEPLIVNSNGELIVGSGVSINGGGHSIDFNKQGSLTLKGNDIRLSNINIENAKNSGIQIYKSENVMLDGVHVKNSEKYDILVNGSNATLNNCSTSNNNKNSVGIMVCRNISLLTKYSGKDSNVKVTGSLNQDGSATKILVKNSEMIDVDTKNQSRSYMQDNVLDLPESLKQLAEYTEVKMTEKTLHFDELYKDGTSIKTTLEKLLKCELKKYENESFKEVTYKYGVNKK